MRFRDSGSISFGSSREDPERDCQVRLAHPGGPRTTTFSLAVRKSSWPRWKDERPLHGALEADVELLERLSGREGPLDPGLVARASREATSVASSALAKRSYDHSSCQARSASLGSARVAAAAFRARKRKLSSACFVMPG
jgi:hypothetical protein